MSDSYTAVKVDKVLLLCTEARKHFIDYQDSQNDKKISEHIELQHYPKTRWVKWYKRETYMPDPMTRLEAIQSLDDVYKDHYWKKEWRDESCTNELTQLTHLQRLCEESLDGEITISSTHMNTLKARYILWKAPE